MREGTRARWRWCIWIWTDSSRSTTRWATPPATLLLKMVAERLVATVREEDTVARLGGDEFMIALWHVSGIDDAATVARKVIEAVSQPYDIEGHTVSITTSAGVGIYPVHGEDAETLMKSADLALYEAKRAGKNAYRVSKRYDAADARRGAGQDSRQLDPDLAFGSVGSGFSRISASAQRCVGSTFGWINPAKAGSHG